LSIIKIRHIFRPDFSNLNLILQFVVSTKMEEQGRNGGQEDIYSFKTDSPMGSDSSDPDCKVSRTAMASVKYKRKLWRNSTDDEDEVPCIKPCIVLLQRSKVSCRKFADNKPFVNDISQLCEAAWKRERENTGQKEPDGVNLNSLNL
jgi:hypothetical protein